MSCDALTNAKPKYMCHTTRESDRRAKRHTLWSPNDANFSLGNTGIIHRKTR